jgi:hypothetical protein
VDSLLLQQEIIETLRHILEETMEGAAPAQRANMRFALDPHDGPLGADPTARR